MWFLYYNYILCREVIFISTVFRKDEIITIPNILSMFRLALLPVILWVYLGTENIYMVLSLMLLSGFTDILDGFIARRFNMSSNFGKIIDPIADKCTQGTLFICLGMKYPLMWVLLGIFVVKETVVSVMGCISIKRRRKVSGAKWYGKLNTVVIYFTILILILFPSIPRALANLLILSSGVTIVLSWVMYVLLFKKLISAK